MSNDEAAGRHALGAWLLAVGRLQADDATANEIAGLLGLHGALSAVSADEPVISDPRPGIGGASLAPFAVTGTGTVTAPVILDVRPPPSAEGPIEGLDVVKLSGPATAPVTQVAARMSQSSWTPGALPFAPLLFPLGTRAALTAALAQRTAGGEIDVERLVDGIARFEPLASVPRLPRSSLAGGARVLIDRGTGMQPFARDARDLAERIRAVASRDRTEVLSFWRTPRLVGPSRGKAKPAPLPPRGTVVVALTDLGIAPDSPPSLENDWLALSGELRKAGCPLVVFVPYPAERRPPRLAELAVVTWDRHTTIRDVVLAARRQRGIA